MAGIRSITREVHAFRAGLLSFMLAAAEQDQLTNPPVGVFKVAFENELEYRLDVLQQPPS